MNYMNFKTKIASATGTAVLLSTVLSASAFAATNVTISGNGAKSNNTVKLNDTKSTTVVQGNLLIVSTKINSSANTGGNKAKDNSGDTTITTGKATSMVTVGVGGNSNSVTLPNCGCEDDLTVDISDNLRKSKNKVKKTSSDHTLFAQGNAAIVGTEVDSKAKTGKNKASDILGDATVEITTKPADSIVEVGVEGGSNVINP